MKPTGDWQEYDGDYEKKIQDIRLKSGREVLKCWPNAGKWNVLSNNKGELINNDSVTHVRLNKQENELQ